MSPCPKQDTPIADDGRFAKVWWLFLKAVERGLQRAVYGGLDLTHPGAIPKVAGPGTLGESRFTETQVLYMDSAVQSGLTALAAALGTADAGKLIEVTDFRHILRWTGSAWQWGPGEDGRHDIVGLPVDPSPTTGWHLCDGSTVTYLKGDGTTGSYATPDLVSAGANAAYLKFGDPVSGPNAAVAPTLSGASVASAATGITAATSGPSATIPVVQGTGTTISMATATHTHVVAVTDPHHTHTLSGAVGADGEPQNMVLRPWFRR